MVIIHEGGQEVHLNLQELLKSDEGWECEEEIIWKSPGSVSIIGHVDAVYRKDGLVVAVEIKTTHSEKPTPFSYNIRQLKYYLAILNADYGKLLYIRVGLNNGVRKNRCPLLILIIIW